MTIKELKEKLNCFAEHHIVKIEVVSECGYNKAKSDIEDVQFKEGECVLYGENY